MNCECGHPRYHHVWQAICRTSPCGNAGCRCTDYRRREPALPAPLDYKDLVLRRLASPPPAEDVAA